MTLLYLTKESCPPSQHSVTSLEQAYFDTYNSPPRPPANRSPSSSPPIHVATSSDGTTSRRTNRRSSLSQLENIRSPSRNPAMELSTSMRLCLTVPERYVKELEGAIALYMGENIEMPEIMEEAEFIEFLNYFLDTLLMNTVWLWLRARRQYQSYLKRNLNMKPILQNKAADYASRLWDQIHEKKQEPSPLVRLMLDEPPCYDLFVFLSKCLLSYLILSLGSTTPQSLHTDM